ncbi:uncharacterized protein [Gossypium hirsutum]|uniref:Uncharacterized protein n=1 Tax=Gossypium hirsutum TaxID=3635 RepID=A0A1U8NY13_GOSHI|nr:uncharacterized protein LOC107952183 [Gossypium hirsutum]
MENNTISLSLQSVFNKDKLNGKNFLDWFSANASKADKDAYKKNLNDMLDIGCLMLSTMTLDLQKQHEDMVAYDMIQHLKELYERQERQERYETSRPLFQCKMVEGTSVGTHVLKIIGSIESLEKLGYPLGMKLATDVILQLFSDSFSQFVLNFNINEINKIFPQFLNMLRTTESNIKKARPKPILMVCKDKGKGKAKAETKPKDNGKA